MDAMGLGSSKDVHTVRKGPLKKGQGKGQRQGQGQKHSSNTPVETAPSITPQGAPPAQQKTPNAEHVGRLTLESEVPLQGQTVLLWTTRTPTQQGR